jgi:sugar phosphate isomerase/epimerase
MMLAYHDHPGDFRTVDGELEWLILFENTHRLKIQFDIGNALEGGQQAAPLLKQFPGRFVSAHVKDYSATDNANTLLGQGDENWKELIPILKGRHGPRWFIIEQETYPLPPLECARRCLANFEQLMK